jgi:hypothetical protein
LARRRRLQRGSELLEFAIAFPILVMMTCFGASGVIWYLAQSSAQFVGQSATRVGVSQNSDVNIGLDLGEAAVSKSFLARIPVTKINCDDPAQNNPSCVCPPSGTAPSQHVYICGRLIPGECVVTANGQRQHVADRVAFAVRGWVSVPVPTLYFGGAWPFTAQFIESKQQVLSAC